MLSLSSSLFSVLLFSLICFHFGQSERFVARVDENHSFDFELLAREWNVKYVGPLKTLPHIHVFETIEEGQDITQLGLLKRSFPEGEVLWTEALQTIKYRPIPTRPPETKRWQASDPRYNQQWHIQNIRATEAWDLGYSGQDVIVSVLDDGVNKAETDLGNLDMSNSWNYVTGKNDPSPNTQSCINYDDTCEHGTFCSTLAVGETNNFCGVGIGPSSTLQGFAILPPAGSSSGVSISDYVEALTHPTYVSSNSYGPVTCEREHGQVSCSLSPITKLEIEAFQYCLEHDRDGKGVIFLFAAGNDGDLHEDTNFQGTLTLRGVMAIGASDQNYDPTYWSCPGAGLMCLAPGYQMFGSTIVIDKQLQEVCETIGSGTSFATPVVAGAMSVLLEANPDLTWRDVQHLIVRSSYRQKSVDWVTNAAGRDFSYTSGFGNLDLYAAVVFATNWTVFPQEQSTTTRNQTRTTVTSTSEIYLGIQTDLVVESVNLVLDISVQRRGGLVIELTSPGGTTHTLFKARPDYEANYANWPVLARGFWDERSPGWWILRVIQDSTYTSAGKTTVNSVTLTVYGTDPSEYPENPQDPPQHDDPEPGQTNDSSRVSQTIQMVFISVVLFGLLIL